MRVFDADTTWFLFDWYKLDAPVLSSTLRCVIGRHEIGLAKSLRNQPVRWYSMIFKVRGNCLRTTLREALICSLAARRHPVTLTGLPCRDIAFTFCASPARSSTVRIFAC